MRTLGLVASLSVLVFIHELGHYLFARLFGTKVDKFYLFFDYKFSLVKFTKWGTEFGIGWIPFGGYCKIAGMIDESMDKEQMKSEPQEWEYRAKPAWQRLLIITGGVLFNMILAMLIYISLAWKNGESTLPLSNMTYGMVFNETLKAEGFQDGDIVLDVDGEVLADRAALVNSLLLEAPKTVRVNRKGEVLTLNLNPELSQEILKAGSKSLLRVLVPTIIEEVTPNSNAQKAGLQAQDRILGVNGKETTDFSYFTSALAENKEKEIALTVLRAGDSLELTELVTAAGKLGFKVLLPAKMFEYNYTAYSFIEAVPAGVNQAIATLTNYISQVKLVFSSTEGVKQLGGFGAIASLFPTSWDWDIFWSMTAFLSVMLAFMNILPIPALDGGYVLMILYELITGRKPSDKFLEKVIPIGFFLLIGLLLYANLNDVFRLFSN